MHEKEDKRAVILAQVKILFNLMVDYKIALIIFIHMVEQNLSQILKACSDETRRSILTTLVQQGPTRVTDLAARYQMSLNSVSKHIKVLESASLIIRKQHGREHLIEANLENLTLVDEWFGKLKSIWEIRLENLDNILTERKEND